MYAITIFWKESFLNTAKLVTLSIKKENLKNFTS